MTGDWYLSIICKVLQPVSRPFLSLHYCKSGEIFACLASLQPPFHHRFIAALSEEGFPAYRFASILNLKICYAAPSAGAWRRCMRIYVGMCMHAHSLLRQLLDLLIGACVCLKDMYGTAASRSGVGGRGKCLLPTVLTCNCLCALG